MYASSGDVKKGKGRVGPKAKNNMKEELDGGAESRMSRTSFE